MTKLEFILALHDRLYGLPQDEVEEYLRFYTEMIEDRMEDGLLEEEAVAAVGTVDEIISQILADIPLAKIAKEKMKPQRRLKVWEIVLLALGSPIWFSLVIAAFTALFSLYVSLWSVVISLWACFVSLAACALAGALSCAVFVIGGNGLTGIAMLGAGIVCAGLSVFMFYGCKAATKGTILLTKRFGVWMKRCFVKKEVA